MSRLIKISKKDAEVKREYEEDVERVVRQFAPPLQPKVRKAFRLADEGDFENASSLCCRILDEDAEKPEIRYLLAITKGFGEYVSLGEVPYRRSQVKAGRNDPCHCGSGKKYKSAVEDKHKRLKTTVRDGEGVIA